MKKKKPKLGRTRVLMKTGTQVHKPDKGKGSFKRRKKVSREDIEPC